MMESANLAGFGLPTSRGLNLTSPLNSGAWNTPGSVGRPERLFPGPKISRDPPTKLTNCVCVDESAPRNPEPVHYDSALCYCRPRNNPRMGRFCSGSTIACSQPSRGHGTISSEVAGTSLVGLRQSFIALRAVSSNILMPSIWRAVDTKSPSMLMEFQDPQWCLQLSRKAPERGFLASKLFSRPHFEGCEEVERLAISPKSHL